MQSGLKPVTVRLTETAYKALRKIASEHGFSLSEVLRVVVDMDLERYRKGVMFADYEQGEAIQGQLLILANTMQDILYQLRRIGINYNQELRIRQTKLREIREERERIKNMKYLSTWDKVTREMELNQAEQAEIDKLQGFDADAVKKLIDQYREVTREVGESICHILE